MQRTHKPWEHLRGPWAGRAGLPARASQTGCQALRDKRRKIRKTAGGEGRQGVRTVTPKGQAGGGVWAVGGRGKQVEREARPPSAACGQIYEA